ncbi:hypothetical protein HNR09_000505 [Nesterenkonia xinjiangensis]|uniref:Uncharacterized protein n=1 Tax=Nesterenkonia xinjiangensis TaxID=225327 RepID=A0A7Z0GKI1_9MICC|nr:hypothetical protein [Nesterenkonia xinjiangensis]
MALSNAQLLQSAGERLCGEHLPAAAGVQR